MPRALHEWRAYALRLLPSQPRSASKDGKAPTRKFPKGLTLELLKEMLDANNEILSLEVIRTLANNPTAGQKLLAKVAADSKRSAQLRAEAIAGLGSVAKEHQSLLVKLADSGDSSIRMRRCAV